MQLTKALRAGRQERFDVHELGIAHLTDAGRRKWTWDQRGGPTQGARNRLRRFGWDHTCRADFTDGASIQFNGLTTDAESIIATVYTRYPNATALTSGPSSSTRGRVTDISVAVGRFHLVRSS